MLSIFSTSSSGVGTHTTSLPGWPTRGSNPAPAEHEPVTLLTITAIRKASCHAKIIFLTRMFVSWLNRMQSESCRLFNSESNLTPSPR